MNDNITSDSIEQIYQELLKLLETENSEKTIRDKELLNVRIESSTNYFTQFQNKILANYPSYGFLHPIEFEAKRFAVYYAYYLELYRNFVVSVKFSDTLMSIYKIISASQATIITSRPIVNLEEPSDKSEKTISMLADLNGRLAQFYGLELLIDWIGDEETQNQNILYRSDVLSVTNKFTVDLVNEHLLYLQNLAFEYYATGNNTFELFLMAQYWKLFHYFLFDPRTQRNLSI